MSRFVFITFFSFTALLSVGVPLMSFATAPSQTKPYLEAYVPCGTDDVTGAKGGGPDGIVDNPCGFKDVVDMARRIIMGWIIAGVTFASLGFAYAGFLYITAMGSQEKISHAHSIFVKTFFGFVFMLSAWLIAKTLENTFLTKDFRDESLLIKDVR